ncbi:(S)-benzoin forming benzil reductase [Aquibacillus halophilus]|uniref:(S)-benzoin forming benzil reductase n=1 Tax=Aquibacillus halophilus TaxID=930132 RepID=A0A6A8DS92_9BACI|nr:(S)-benzoin forming benzil reductase [Aquibacillus halophilus]MRH44092.1 (S)-benzoin forming benzil reductase [Aquibacillus halophilus]
MKYAVVTGASRGLGESIAKLLIQQGCHVIGVSRSKNDELEKLAEENAVTYQHESCDLSSPDAVQHIFNLIAERVFLSNVETVHLINNAGVVEPIDTAGSSDVEDLAHHINVNLLAPMATTNLFLKRAKETKVPVVVTNVTSGAAERSVYGWSAYCSTKAGLNRFTETVALEQEELATANKVILFNPGIMDTEMQGQIRSINEEAFKDVQTFRDYKTDNDLRETDVVADALVTVLLDVKQIVSGKNYNVSDLL